MHQKTLHSIAGGRIAALGVQYCTNTIINNINNITIIVGESTACACAINKQQYVEHS